MNINCPICDYDKKEVISKLCDNIEIMSRVFPKSVSYNVECMNCGCVYVDMDANQKNFTDYYREHAKCLNYHEAFGYNITEEYYNNIYSKIKNYITEESNIIDIGCGYGEFVEFLNKKGHKNVLGIEPSINCVKLSKEKNLNIIQSDSFGIDISHHKKYDMVIFSHVGEHILDFKKALENIKSIMKDNAFIYMEFPDATRYCDVNSVPYFFYTYEHLFHVTKDTLYNIASAYDLELINEETYLKLETYYVLYGLYKNNDEKSKIKYSDILKTKIKEYSAFSNEKLKPIIEVFEKSNEKLILWGVGASTAILLNDSFDNCNIVQVVDSNISKQGINITISNKKLKIEDPSKITDDSTSILVLPMMYSNLIAKQIRNINLKNKILFLNGGEYE